MWIHGVHTDEGGVEVGVLEWECSKIGRHLKSGRWESVVLHLNSVTITMNTYSAILYRFLSFCKCLYKGP
jgi:hypothetical protein